MQFNTFGEEPQLRKTVSLEYFLQYGIYTANFSAIRKRIIYTKKK